MKKFIKAIALGLAMLTCLSFPIGVSAAEVVDATIDFDRKGSLTIYKVDLTNAEKDGVWDSSYVSTGVYDEQVYNTFVGTNRDGDNDNTSDLGNGEKSYGYAIKGVEFSILKVADIVQFSESTADGRTDNHVEVLYGINKTVGADFLKALGLENGAQRYANADKLDETKYFYQSDVLINALASGLEANSTTVKNALEKYMANNGGVKLAPTDAYGKTQATDLDLGLYLCVETAVPEMVVSTVNPFLVSLPMTSVSGSNATDGGTRWIYDVTTFPKNLTGIPELEKTLREQVADTGKNGGSTTDITDGYAHTGTASAGDIIDYQIISTLPSITSESTYLTCYTFIDTLSKGISYKKHDVVLEFFADKGCTDLITTWKESDGFFTVTYGSTAEGESVMTIEMTARGLSEINSSKAVYPGATMVNSGYSDCTLRITYQAVMDSDNSLVFGDQGNPNEVVLTWKRSNTSYYDTLVDDAHVYTATEVRTDNGYTLLRDDIEIVISQVETVEVCDIYQSDVVGLIQNDSRYTEAIISEAISKGYIKTNGGLADILNNMPQKQLEHHLLTASASVDGNAVNMLEDSGSINAHAPLTVVNTRGFDLPSTGDRGVWMYGLLGILLMTGSAVTIIVTSRKKSIQK